MWWWLPVWWVLWNCCFTAGMWPKPFPPYPHQLGKVVRTNSEAIVGVLSPETEMDLTYGTAISSHFYPDDHTHITQNRFPNGYTFMKFFTGPLVDHPNPTIRSLKTLGAIAAHPSHADKNLVCQKLAQTGHGAHRHAASG